MSLHITEHTTGSANQEDDTMFHCPWVLMHSVAPCLTVTTLFVLGDIGRLYYTDLDCIIPGINHRPPHFWFPLCVVSQYQIVGLRGPILLILDSV